MDNMDTLAKANQSPRHDLRRIINRLIDMADYDREPEIEKVELGENERLFAQGDEGHNMYILTAGVLGVRVRMEDGTEAEVARLAPVSVVGEMALLNDKPRSATVYGVNHAGLIRVSKNRFLQLLEEDEQALAALNAAAAPRWQRDQLLRVLSNLLGSADPALIDAIEEQAEWLYYANGDVVFNQGDKSDGLYLVINGRLRVTLLERDGSESFMGEISAGEMVGEMGVLTGSPRSATVRALRSSSLVRISPAEFRQLTRRYPQLMTRIALTLVERKQETMRGAQTPIICSLNIAIVPAGPDVDGQAFARELESTLAQFGSTLAMDAKTFDDRFGQEGAAQAETDDPRLPAITAWMNKIEFNYATILYVADAQPTAWTRRCIGQADRILIVADPGADPAPGPVEEMLWWLEAPLRCELVLWHAPETEQPQGTKAWLDARQVRCHYHVRRDDAAHMERLARRLTGRAVALVCSGGAARAYAALGVYKAMRDQDIPIDFVSGTSMGAILAGAVALEYDYDEMLEMARWTADYGVADYTLPLASLMSSEHVTRICQRAFGQHQIEDLWIPYFCVSTNLSTAEPVYHQQGSMWRAIRASMAIPGIYLPVTENEEVLVDGGAMDNFPVRKTIELADTEHVIGVHVSPYKERKRTYDYDTALSGWRILLSRINPFQKTLRTPSFLDTIMRTVEVNGVRLGRADEDAVELLIHPDVRGTNPTDYTAYKQLAEIGYEAALDPLRAWQQNSQPSPANP